MKKDKQFISAAPDRDLTLCDKSKELIELERIIDAHKYSSNHRTELLKDKKCGCFYCLKIFKPKKIQSFIEDISGTAMCPFCNIDSVIGESSGYPITREFLKKMEEYWF